MLKVYLSYYICQSKHDGIQVQAKPTKENRTNCFHTQFMQVNTTSIYFSEQSGRNVLF